MSKMTKKDRIKVLEWQVKTLMQSMNNIEEWSSCADNMLTELNHALPDPEYDAKCEAAVAGVEASLDRHRERLGLNKPQLKQLGQSDDIAKELLEADLSSELTGSELCKAMLERGDRFVMCMADDGTDVIYDLACFVSSTHPYIGRLDNYRAVTPINNQGEPLTAAEAGL